MTPEQASSMPTTADSHTSHPSSNPHSRPPHNNPSNPPHRRGRPTFAPHQSNSVPSTPHQLPRDLRFSSRSPSPSKTLTANSPHSVASEAVSAHPPPRLAQPPVCKFEIGAEIKKRRIIYTEGGNDPLPPPKQAPKKALEPHEDDKLTGDMRELYDRLLPTRESEVRRAKLVQKLDDILHNEWPGHEIKVNVFGSSGNLLSSNDSDGASARCPIIPPPNLSHLDAPFADNLPRHSRRLHHHSAQEARVHAQPRCHTPQKYVFPPLAPPPPPRCPFTVPRN